MNELAKIIGLLGDAATERRIAAAIVLGAIEARGAEVVDGLLAMVESGEPVLARHGLDALAALAAKKAAPRMLPFVSSPDAEVRRAAARALVAVGDTVVPLIRERMKSAGPEEQRALNQVLAEVGGTEAFATLLGGMVAAEADPGAAIAARQQVRGADAGLKRKYLAETERFLKAQRKSGEHPRAVAAAIKILGFLEDPKAVPTLLAHVAGADLPPAVRQEAIIGLRFALSGGSTPPPGVVEMLVEAAGAEDRALAQTALLTLGALKLEPKHAERIRKLADHPDFERARHAIEHLGRERDAHATRALVDVLASGERRRAELAANALATREDAGAPLAKALMASTDGDRARLVARALAPRLRDLSPALRKQIRQDAVTRLERAAAGFEALVDMARMSEPGDLTDDLRALAAKQRKSGKTDDALRTLAVLCRSDQATDADRYGRASLELERGAPSRGSAPRSHDPALQSVAQLAGRGFDVGAALRKDKALDTEDLYYVGFHFAERGHPLGVELLDEVVKRAGRTKLGKMAKNKLALSPAAESA